VTDVESSDKPAFVPVSVIQRYSGVMMPPSLPDAWAVRSIDESDAGSLWSSIEQSCVWESVDHAVNYVLD
jgi:hypothetical protein